MRSVRPLLFLAVFLLSFAALAATQMMSVQVRTGQLRSRPSFLGKVEATVSYGDRLEILESRGGWIKVKNEKATGWIHESALSEKKIALKSGQKDVAAGASGDELALAGKGFNDEVEGQYRQNNPKLDFQWVDRMEDFRVDAKAAAEFLAKGQVKPGEVGE
jgi:uncharacterized protein YgiM (DUF1202 family)